VITIVEFSNNTFHLPSLKLQLLQKADLFGLALARFGQ
jgi:hypothetical protein